MGNYLFVLSEEETTIEKTTPLELAAAVVMLVIPVYVQSSLYELALFLRLIDGYCNGFCIIFILFQHHGVRIEFHISIRVN